MKSDINDTNWLHFLRKAELFTIIAFLPSDKKSKILEIGGGDGFEAKQLSDLGYSVTSIDPHPKNHPYFEVQNADVTKLEFNAESIDVIFSSHVLQHIKNINLALDEMKKILKKEGIMIHIVPTTSWSIVTNFWHYVLLPYNILHFIKQKKSKISNTNTSYNTNQKKSGANKIINFLFFHPLGENPSFIHEFFYFSDYFWKKLFTKNGLVVLQKGNCPYLYSGYGVFKMRFLVLRSFVKRYLTGSRYYIVKKI